MNTHDPPRSAATTLGAGMEALERGAWEEARSAFEQALREEESPEALFGLGDALWWMGEIRESAHRCEQAYTAFRRRPDPVQAVTVAVQISFLYHANLGNYAAAAGWTARAARLVDEFALEPLQGWVLLLKTAGCTDPTQIEEWARQARQMAVEVGDRDLELCALSQIGVALISQGRIGEGVPFIDEAMAGALAGEGKLDTVVFTSCHMMESCSRCADFQRIAQWVQAADQFVERYGCPYLNATCRAHYGSVLFATGEWQDAEQELQKAIELSGDAQPVVRSEALAWLAELRLAQGRIEEAQRLLAGFEDYEAAAPVSARIQLQKGKFALAASTVQRRLGIIGENRLESALLLEVLGQTEIGQGNIEEAAERGRKLAELGGALGCHLMSARGERLRGHALATVADAEANAAAKRHLDAALCEFVRLEMPYETARTRLLIAQALRELAPEVSEAEIHAALAVFENLGASDDADATTALVRAIEGGKQTSKIPNLAGLSRREVEVLRLVAQGLGDKEIAARLILSPHTIHRHMSSILTKLNLPSRAAAVGYAARHDLL
jgi:DNA-binding NarL/FixJ family response regulator/thioredoxin-like negative regulator of GroEL